MRANHRQRFMVLLWTACLLGLAGVAGCANTAPRTWPLRWQVQGNAQHPLTGRIWHPASQSWVTPAQLRAAVAKARFLLLGETHDNPDHHRLQAQLLRTFVAAGRRPVVAFEMLNLDQQGALDAFLQGPPDDASGLGAAVGWADTGWPPWSIYRPIAEVVLDHGLAMLAAEMPQAKVKAVAIHGLAALEPERITELGLDRPLPPAWRETMLDELYVSHCELMPRAALAGMVAAQRVRNATMARRMRAAAGEGSAVLIAGGGHARTDFGVPMRLRRNAAGAAVLSVVMVEARAGRDKPADYAANYQVARLPFDYVLFTPRVERQDPCIALRKRFGGAGSSTRTGR